jgi:beta-barrel assembly-enhancing protease
MMINYKLLFLLVISNIIMANISYADTRLPYADTLALQKLEPEEQRVWSASQDFEKAIRKGGQIYPSAELDAYLQGVMDKLYPEFIGAIKVHVVSSPVLNAFAIPNGNIYLNSGLLARFDNEAQLATVLAHEGAHFVYRHGYYNQQSIKGSAAFATITGVIGVPIVGLIGNVVAMSSIFGYSRELETEADNMGFERLLSAGYDVNEAAKVFEHLAAEVKLSDVKESVFYSTHPKLQDRVDNFTKLAAKQSYSGEINSQEYADKISKLRVEDLDLELSFGRYKHIIALLSDEKVLKRYPNTVHYYLGEAYRKRNEKDDATQSMLELDKAIAMDAGFAPSYRSKGLLLMSQQKNDEATKQFSRYLELAPDAADKSYVESYLETVAKK